MANIYDVDANEFIDKVAEELNKNENIKAPEWACYVKTGIHKERAPLREDWWYVRVAAVLRKIYKYGPIGVSKLRIKYGGKKNRGHKPDKFYRGSGNIIRKILQQLEKAGFLKKEEKAIHRGRVITPQGKSFLDKIATQMYKISNVKKVEEVKPKELKPEVKKELVKEVKPDVKKEVKVEVKEPVKEVSEKPKVEAKKEDVKVEEAKK